MKIRKYILPILAGALLLVSCEDFLDITPKGKVIPKTYNDFNDLQTQAYYTYPSHKSLLALRTDEVKLLPDEANFEALKDVYTWSDDSQNKSTQQFPWQTLYKVIMYENHIINEFDTTSYGTSAENRQLLAEAYANRAYVNFELVNMFSKPYNASTASTDKAAPMVTKIDVEQSLPLSTVQKMYDHILSDLTKAEKLATVNKFTDAQKFRFGKTAIQAFKVRYYLYKGELAEAKKAALAMLAGVTAADVLEDLNAAEAKLPNNYASKESILALENTFNSTMVTNTTPSDELVNSYDQSNDLRFDKYYEFPWYATSRKVAKASSDVNSCTFRYAEIYLTLAEIEAREGEVSKAAEYLNVLRKFRFKPDYYTTEETRVNAITDRDVMISEVMTERFREFAFEGHRWYDLRRTTQPAMSRTINEKEYKLAKDDSRYTISFPREAVANNPNLIN